MQDLVRYLRKELPDIFKGHKQADFQDRGLTGLHLLGPSVLLKGIRIEGTELPNVMIELNRTLNENPIRVQLRDGKSLDVYAVDLIVTEKGSVYLGDILDGSFV